MITLDTMVNFFGWMTVLNTIFLLLTSIILIFFREPIIRLHSKLTGVAAERLPQAYFEFLGNYKLAIILLNLSPYLALELMH